MRHSPLLNHSRWRKGRRRLLCSLAPTTDVFVYRHFGLLICVGLVYGPCGLASVMAKYMLPRSLPPSYIDSFMLEDLVPSYIKWQG
jgi:hypothetical protein